MVIFSIFENTKPLVLAGATARHGVRTEDVAAVPKYREHGRKTAIVTPFNTPHVKPRRPHKRMERADNALTLLSDSG